MGFKNSYKNKLSGDSHFTRNKANSPYNFIVNRSEVVYILAVCLGCLSILLALSRIVTIGISTHLFSLAYFTE